VFSCSDLLEKQFQKKFFFSSLVHSFVIEV
jgi:hypothetical protein